MPSSHLILCRPLLLLPSIPPSIRVFSSESTLRMRWPKYWSFSFSITPSKEHPGLISFRMDWLDLLAVQGTLKSLLQHHSSKASILWHSAFFIVQFSLPYMTTGKTIALTRRTFVGKVMSLLFNMLSRLVIDFLGGSDGKVSVYNVGDPDSIPGLGRSPGEGNGNLLCILAWKIPWTEEPDRLYRPWGHKESDTTEFTQMMMVMNITRSMAN
uniref:Uncharacterized protein n=1 Tax=Ovis aries TaxID=9940 RepID=A0AC11E1C8_SHEEP